jgi:ribosomal protein L11 methylase PrmA
LVADAKPRSVWDIGGNNGEFSRTIKDLAENIICMDMDPAAVDQNYRLCKQQGITNILPLVVDLTNPTPGLGFANRERPALFERTQPDLIVALALIHHLCIGSNLPFSHVARLFAHLAPTLLIEFVPKSDSQVQRLLASRKDIFPNYDQETFAAEFSACFGILDKRPIPGTERTLYLMARREGSTT